MDIEILKVVLAALGPSTACVIVTLRFVRFIENHMGQNTQALQDVCSTLAGLAAKVDECPERGRT